MKCPKCGSVGIYQYRQLTGAIWCQECGYTESNKEIYNPFELTSSECKFLHVDIDKLNDKEISQHIENGLEIMRLIQLELIKCRGRLK